MYEVEGGREGGMGGQMASDKPACIPPRFCGVVTVVGIIENQARPEGGGGRGGHATVNICGGKKWK